MTMEMRILRALPGHVGSSATDGVLHFPCGGQSLAFIVFFFPLPTGSQILKPPPQVLVAERRGKAACIFSPPRWWFSGRLSYWCEISYKEEETFDTVDVGGDSSRPERGEHSWIFHSQSTLRAWVVAPSMTSLNIFFYPRPQGSGDERKSPSYEFTVSPTEEGSESAFILGSAFTSFKEDDSNGKLHIHGNLCSEHHAHFAN